MGSFAGVSVDSPRPRQYASPLSVYGLVHWYRHSMEYQDIGRDGSSPIQSSVSMRRVRETQNPSYRIVSLLRHPTTGDSGYKSRLRIVEKRRKHTDDGMDYHELHMVSSPFPGSKNRKALYCRVFIHVTVSKDSDCWDKRQSTGHFPKV